MLETILNHVHNFFEVEIHKGNFSVVSGSISLDFLIPGQYFRVFGSVLNDGVWQYPATQLMDETFDGEIWALAIPRAVLNLSQEIEQWVEKNPESAITSESFGGYSYSKAQSSNGGGSAGWQDVFRSRLNAWRKL